MKILVHSNGPDVKTGYGVQVAMLVDRLVEDGHTVGVSSTYGHLSSQGIGRWTTPHGKTVPVYPSRFDAAGNDVLIAHCKQFFADDDGLLIPLLDMWSLSARQVGELKQMNVAAWTPVDHAPVPEMVTDFFAWSNATCVAMTRFGETEFRNAGLEPTYIPLAVDTKVYKPTFSAVVGGKVMNAREFLNVPPTAFCVGMVGMNKDPNDRKGFSEAFQAFAEFQKTHTDAILHVHSERHAHAGGIDLVELGLACGIPDHALRFTNQYAYMVGLPPDLMALIYTAFDVLLAPSVGEGFCVPLVEAQACGVPVIASDFTAQPELVGAGWTVGGQKWWDAASRSWYQRPNIDEIVAALEAAYNADLELMQLEAQAFAQNYDIDKIYDEYWRPFIEASDPLPPATRPPMDKVAIIVPALNRPANVPALVKSFKAHGDGASLYYVCDADDIAQIAAVEKAGASWVPAHRGTSFAGKVNSAYEQLGESFDWLFACGDDVEFTEGWLKKPRELSPRFDVIGTNDSEPGRIRNPKVAEGKHADHFFIRRAYIDNPGSSLEGPGCAFAEAYYHWYGDVEVIQLAKARGVWTPCLESVVIHHHPGYDGNEKARQNDPTYMKAVEFSEMDKIAFSRRAGLIDQHKIVKKDIWA